MLQQDYLMRMILQFVEAIRFSLKGSDKDPLDAAENIERAISQTTDIDENTLFSMDPDSFVMLMQVSNIDAAFVPYIVHSIMLESIYLDRGKKTELSQLRKRQAESLARAYGVEMLDDSDLSEGTFLN